MLVVYNKRMKSDLIKELNWRGLLYQHTPGIEKTLLEPTTLYYGIDPTADSLQFGNLLGISVLKRALDAGHSIVVLTGGGTAMIGDPGGKDKERPISPIEVVKTNTKKVKQQLLSYFKGQEDRVKFVDNADWLEHVTLISFLRDAGKFISINSMLDKDSVSTRLSRDTGMSYAEFSYQLLQAYDYLELFQKNNCRVQIGGSDQWGNIVQGVELIRKKLSQEVHALSWPLIVDPKTGRKFGKSEGGKTMWLDAEKTHPLEFFQFFVNTEDILAPTLLRYFSFKTQTEIESMEKSWTKQKETRSIQKQLAMELTSFVHGDEVAVKCHKIASILFDKSSDNLSLQDLEFVKSAVPYTHISHTDKLILENVLPEMGMVTSKGEARRLIQQNGVKSQQLFDKYFLIRKGKHEYGVVEVI